MSQMDQVIARLSEIDTAAQTIMNQAAVKKKELEEQNNQERKAFDQELEVKVKETLEGLKDKINQQSRTQLEEMKKKNEKALAALEEEFQSNHEQVAEELFRKIIEVS